MVYKKSSISPILLLINHALAQATAWAKAKQTLSFYSVPGNLHLGFQRYLSIAVEQPASAVKHALTSFSGFFTSGYQQKQ